MTGTDHVLVARLDNAGDVLLTGPAVRAIAHDANRVSFLAGPAGAEAAAMLPGVDEVLTFDAPWVGFNPAPTTRAAIERTIAVVASRAPDRAFVFTSFHQSPLPLALLLRLAGVPWIGAYSTDYPGSLLDARLTPPPHAHEVERALALAAAGGHRLPPDDDGALAITAPLCRVIRDRYVVLHPGASVPARAIPVETATAVARALARRGWDVVVTGTAAEAAVAAQIAGAAGRRGRACAGRTSWADLADLVGHADVVVCGNTGPAHLAAAVGTPVVSVFAPVVPLEQWRPWRVRHVVLGTQDVPCAGCRARTCPIPGQPCLRDVTPDAVVDAVDALARPALATA